MNVNEMIEFLAALVILIGAIVAVISAVGIIRFPDVYTRSHAATKASTLAVLLTLTGAFLYYWIVEGFISVRLILGIIFVFLTSPVSGHLIARAAYRKNVPMAELTVEDELADAIREKKESKGE